MLAKVLSCAVIGLEGAIVQLEADASRGLPRFTVVARPIRSPRNPGSASERPSRTPPGLRRHGLTVNLVAADLQDEGAIPIVRPADASRSCRAAWLVT